MKTNTSAKCLSLLLGIAVIFFFSSCSKDHSSGSGTTAKSEGYRLMEYIFEPNGQGAYLLSFDSLMSGSISPVNNGIDVTGTFPAYATFYNKGYYYYCDNNIFYKYKVDTSNNQLVRIGGIAFPYYDIGRAQRYWVGDNTLVTVGVKDSAIYYGIVDVSSMSLTASGKLDIPFYSGATIHDPSSGAELTPTISINSFKVDGSNALVEYSFGTNPNIDGVGDVLYYAKLDYPAMSNISAKTYTKSGWYPAGDGQFYDENGNSYEITDKGGAGGEQHAIYRIKKGEFYPDATYNFPLSYKDCIIPFGCYIGNGKALLGFSSYNHSDTHLIVDVNAQTVIRNLGTDLPDAANSFVWNGFIENGKLYFPFLKYDDKSANIYEYDPATDKLTKGLEIDGTPYSIQLFNKIEGE